MFSAIFVDDELFIRQQISSIFLWLDDDVKLINTFSNVSDTVMFLKNHPVDIVIADIRLKNDSGIEIAKYVKENNLPTKVVLLSAYKSFEYAQDGIKNGVSYYITKPLDIAELKNVIQNLKKDIQASRCLNITQHNSQKILEYFSDLTSDLDHKLSVTHYTFIGQIKLSIKNQFDYDNNTLYQQIDEALQLMQSPLNYVLTKVDRTKAFALVFPIGDISIETFRTIVQQDCLALRNIFQTTEKLDVDCQAVVFPNINPLDFSRTPKKPNTPVADYSDFILNSFVEHLKNDKLQAILPVQRAFVDMLSSPEDKLNFADCIFKKMNISASLHNLPAEKDLTTYIVDVIVQKLQGIDYTSLDSKNNSIKAITSYVQKNFYRDISLCDVAAYMNMNPSYFSRYFKELFGVNFSEYLMKFRIDKAKSYLEKNISINAVASAVGYLHPQTFYNNFKKVCGITPTEYRNSLNLQEED